MKNKIKSAISKLKDIYRKISDKFPFTSFGIMLILLTSFAFWYFALKHFDLAYFVMTLLSWALILSLTLWTLVSYAIIRFRMRRKFMESHQFFETEALSRTGYKIPALRYWPLITLKIYWEYPDFIDVNYTGKGAYRDEEIVAHRRGLFQVIKRKYVLSDVLGLSEISWSSTYNTNITILPNKGKLSTFTVLPTLVKGEDISHPKGEPIGDLVDMRRYVPGDSPRRILWKVYAHSRKLMVRIPERAIASAPKTSAFLFNGEGDEASAGFARFVIESGLLGKDWLFGADGTFDYTDNVDKALNIIAESGNFPIDDEISFFKTYLKVSRSHGNHNLLLFVPCRKGKWETKIELLKNDPFLDVSIVMVLDNEVRKTPFDWWMKFIFSNRANEFSQNDYLSILNRLNKFTRKVNVINRQTGKITRT